MASREAKFTALVQFKVEPEIEAEITRLLYDRTTPTTFPNRGEVLREIFRAGLAATKAKEGRRKPRKT